MVAVGITLTSCGIIAGIAAFATGEWRWLAISALCAVIVRGPQR